MEKNNLDAINRSTHLSGTTLNLFLLDYIP